MVVRPTKMTHSLKGIKKGRRFGGLERTEVILLAISQNPSLNHNSLKKLICVELDAMAIVTFERYLHRLIDQETISVKKSRNKKLYSITEPIPYHSKTFLKSFDNQLRVTKDKLEEIKKEFSTYPKIKQNTIMMNVLKTIRNLSPIIIIISASTTKYEFLKRKSKYDSLIREFSGLLKLMEDQNLTFLFVIFDMEKKLAENELDKYLSLDYNKFIKRKT